jgi:hypothetical protein
LSAIKDNEAVYDEQIHPLMAQIIAICKERQIPMLATFVYAPDGFCTTVMSVDHFYPEECDSEEHKALNAAFRCIKKPPQFVALTITSGPRSAP